MECGRIGDAEKSDKFVLPPSVMLLPGGVHKYRQHFQSAGTNQHACSSNNQSNPTHHSGDSDDPF